MWIGRWWEGWLRYGAASCRPGRTGRPLGIAYLLGWRLPYVCRPVLPSPLADLLESGDREEEDEEEEEEDENEFNFVWWFLSYYYLNE